MRHIEQVPSAVSKTKEANTQQLPHEKDAVTKTGIKKPQRDQEIISHRWTIRK